MASVDDVLRLARITYFKRTCFVGSEDAKRFLDAIDGAQAHLARSAESLRSTTHFSDHDLAIAAFSAHLVAGTANSLLLQSDGSFSSEKRALLQQVITENRVAFRDVYTGKGLHEHARAVITPTAENIHPLSPSTRTARTYFAQRVNHVLTGGKHVPTHPLYDRLIRMSFNRDVSAEEAYDAFVRDAKQRYIGPERALRRIIQEGIVHRPQAAQRLQSAIYEVHGPYSVERFKQETQRTRDALAERVRELCDLEETPFTTRFLEGLSQRRIECDVALYLLDYS